MKNVGGQPFNLMAKETIKAPTIQFLFSLYPIIADMSIHDLVF